MDEHPDNYHLDDEVWIDYDPKAVRGAYHQKAGRVYYISRIDTREVCSVPGIFFSKPNFSSLFQRPYIYQVKDVNDRLAAGYFYGRELRRVPKMTVEKVYRTKRSLEGKELGFVKFKGYDKLVSGQENK